ncbi:hypothetical protein BDB01DRAFT_581622 [Pilobolus umbonatus]|nr:hypothetical protein BDB01DRAFT_581622 [Pilobolus umbonatus]
MEGFLSTLPPYVHTYLSKYPALDTFNVLKELVCFAVLYSTDRDRIMSITRELTSPMKEASIQEEEEEEEVIEQKCPQKKSAMINTFPEWWGHQESEPKTPSPRLPEKPDPPVESYWVSCK